MAKNFKYKYGKITRIDRDAILVEEDKPGSPKKNTYWIEWPNPLKTIEVGTRVSYIEVKMPKRGTFIRNVELRF